MLVLHVGDLLLGMHHGVGDGRADPLRDGGRWQDRLDLKLDGLGGDPDHAVPVLVLFNIVG